MAIKIYKRLTSGVDADYVLHSTESDTTTSETVTGLTPSTSYTFKLIREIGGVQSTPVVVTASSQATPPAPTITGFSPTTGESGDTITITGTGFTGATAVTVNSIAVTSFTVVTANSITAVVPTGSTGKVRVTTAGGTAVSATDFTYTSGGVTSGGVAEVIANLATLSGATTGEITAATAFMNGLVTDGIYDAFPSMHLLIGNSAANKRYNAMDPDSRDAGSFNLLYGTTPLSVSEGLQWQGTGFTKIKLSLKYLPDAPIVGAGVYVDDPVYETLFWDETYKDFSLYYYTSKVWAGVGGAEVGVTASKPLGLIYAMRKDSSTVETFLNAGASAYTTHATAFNTLSDPATDTTKGHLFISQDEHWKAKLIFSIGRYLNATERANFYSRTQTFLTAIGRL